MNTQTTSNYDIWVHATSGTPDDPSDDFDYPLLTLDGSLELRPAWSPDGTNIAFVTNAKGVAAAGTNLKIAVTHVLPAVTPIGPGGGVPYVQSIGTFSILADDGFSNFSPAWSPDSRAIAFSSSRSGGRDIYRMSSMYGTRDLGTFVRLTSDLGSDTNPAWSSDGRTIAFASDRSGTGQIYVMSALLGEADTGNLHRITNDSANENDPAWNPRTTAVQNSLIVVLSSVTVASGVAAPTGSGSVTVSDGFGSAVSGAVVTIVPPSTGSGTLAFAPAAGVTDRGGGFAFVVAEPTLQAPADYQFTVNASDSTTARSGSATATIRVGGSAPPLPGPIPVPPQARLPVGQPVFRQQTKLSFVQQAQAASIEALRDLALEATGFSALLGPIGGAAWDAFTIQSLSSNYIRAAKYLSLANDPPDANFTALAPPVIRAPVSIIASGGPLSVNTLTLMNQTLSERAITNAYLDALIASINRYSTALTAGDLISAALQRNAILAYEDTLTLLLRTEADTTNHLVTSIQADGLPNPQVSSSDIAALQSAIAANGMPSRISQFLLQLGLTSNDIDAIQNSFIGATASSLAGDLIASLQADAGTSQTTSVAFAQASPAVPLLLPTIAIAGGTFVYDGRRHGATMTATGVSGAPVRGLFSVTYSPGGSMAPSNIGTYTVTAQFTSTDPSYTNATGTGTITITSGTPVGTVTSVGGMQFARVSHHATLLANGLVLVSGGHTSGSAIAQAELFNPSTSAWSVTGSNVIPRFDHTATLLQDGRVLVTGGVSAIGDCSSNATSETYDPAKGTWSLIGRLSFPVGTGHIAIRLVDGRVLVSGGGDRCGSVFSTAALFDPSTDTWSATGGMTTAREFHSAALLQDGRVLVAGGVRGSPLTTDASAEIYDPTAGTWTAVAAMGTARGTSCNGYVQPYLAALSGGAVLAAGGFSGANCSPIIPERTVTDVSVTPNSVQLAALGRTQPLTVNVQLSDGSSQLFTGPLQFESANAAIASVDASGVIAAMGVGTTTITVTPSGFAPVAVATTVDTAHLTSISVSPPAISFIGSGQTKSLAINGQFSDGSQQSISTGLTFSSSNTAVVGVDQTGLVTSGANGTATITVSASGVPPVQVPILVKSLIALAPSPTSLTLIGSGQIQALSIVGQYSDGSQQTLATGLTFISSNPSVARVDLSGVVTSGTNGTATITVTAANVPAIQVPVTVKSLVSIALSPQTFALTGTGASQSLTVTGTYSDASTAPVASGVTFSSSDATVATVSPTGVVTSVAPGTATITATVGSVAPAQVNVIVNPAPTVCLPAPSGLVGWWPAEGNGNDLIHGNTGTLLGGATFASGKVGQGFSFNGTDGFVEIPDAPSLDIQTQITLEAWIRPTTLGGRILDKITAGTADGYLLDTDSEGRLRLIVGSRSMSSPPLLTANSFSHVAGTYDGQQLRLYINGALVATLAGGVSIPPNSRTLRIGADSDGLSRSNGVIDEPSVYNRALLGSEIQGIFAAGNAGKCPPTVTPPQPMEADAPVFSVLNLAGITGGQPLSLEVDGRPFSVLNTAGGAPNQPTSKESDATVFSVLNTAGGAPSQPTSKESDAAAFSVLNLAGVTGGEPTHMEADAASVSVLNTAQAPPGTSSPMEADATVVSAFNRAGTGDQPVLAMLVSSYGSNSVLEYDLTTGAFVRAFVPSGFGGLVSPDGILFGPDGNLYVANSDGGPPAVLRYDGQTGSFIDAFVSAGSGGAIAFTDMVFGPNRNLYVSDFSAHDVKEYDGATGEFIKVFASVNPIGAACCPQDLAFGPDGNLYLATEGDIQEFEGATGAFIKSFATGNTDGLVFGADGTLYVSTFGSGPGNSGGQILKYNATTGTLIGVLVSAGAGGLRFAHHITFGPDGKLYAVDSANSQILRFDGTTGAFIDRFVAPGNGGLNTPVNLIFGWVGR
ncbi:MAG TPA: LamG-like jellyroll fold domain-containing protein [Candidatus Eisenbacteria bacterium]|nr:LamG-like jellyroll fold domain-containing protein [Candidatus Eisenbacteria bacterium]